MTTVKDLVNESVEICVNGGTYSNARDVLDWSDSEFWSATPRKYFAHFYCYCERKNELVNHVTKPQVVSPKEVFGELSRIAKMS